MNAGARDAEEMHALTGAYVADALSVDERVRFTAHLAACPNCQAEVAELQETMALFADLEPVAPPDSVRDAVLDQIRTPTDEQPAGNETEEPAGTVSPLVPRHLRPWLVAVAAAAALVVGGVVVTEWVQDDQPSQTTTVADRVLNAPDAQSVEADLPGGATARVVRSLSERKAVLVTSGMPAPPEDKVYELWLQTPEGEMQPAGLMDAGGDQRFVLEGNAAEALAAGITVEPEGGSPEPTSEPIALFDFSQAT